MKRIRKIIFVCSLFVALQTIPATSEAQCPMCRIAVESDLQAGGTQGRGLNAGILYLFAMPYLIVGTLAYVWWKNRLDVEQD